MSKLILFVALVASGGGPCMWRRRRHGCSCEHCGAADGSADSYAGPYPDTRADSDARANGDARPDGYT